MIKYISKTQVKSYRIKVLPPDVESQFTLHYAFIFVHCDYHLFLELICTLSSGI
jgi:hypothetical protein